MTMRWSLAPARQPGQRVGRVPVGVPPGLEMVADEDRIEAHLLREHRELQQLRGANCSADAL